jgi:hypothetical protein
MKKSLVLALSISCLMFTSFVSHAEVKFQGFASFVGGMTLDNDDDSYQGYKNELEYDKNSLYALQASSAMGDGLTVTGQLIARGAENYKPEFEWMYMSYNLTSNLSAKVGRVRTAFYMFSEYLEVGYAFNWIRPPEELYAAQITNLDGVSFLYNMPIGSIDSQYMIAIGNRRNYSEDPATTESDFTSIIQAYAQFESGAYTGKFIYAQGDLSIASAVTNGAVATYTGAGLGPFADKYLAITNSQLIFTGAGLDMDFHPFKILVEVSFLDFEDLVFVSDETRMLASAGYNAGDNTVSYTWSSNIKESEDSLANQVPAGPLRVGVTSNLSNADVTTHTLGLRHDFHDTASVKVELISTEETKAKTEANLLRFGVDVLF